MLVPLGARRINDFGSGGGGLLGSLSGPIEYVGDGGATHLPADQVEQVPVE